MPETSAAPPTADERQAALQAVLGSTTFERAPRLRELLAYLCDTSRSGDPASLNEYRIAVDVFKRGDDFFPGNDAIVRRQAHALRQKLQRCYDDELTNATVRILLPPGNYAPQFVRTSAVVEAAPPSPVARPRARTWVALALAAPLCLTLGWLAGRARPSLPRAPSPAAAAIWGGWLRPGNTVTIALGNPSTAIVRHVPDPVPADAPGLALPAGDPEEARFRDTFRLPPGGRLFVFPDLGQGKISEAQAAVRLAAFLGARGVLVRPTQARFLNWDVLRAQSTILLGHGELNPLVQTLLKDRPFTIEAGPTRESRRIVARRPGAPAQIYESHAPRPGEAVNEQYALISFLPGVGKGLVILAGLGSQATDAAAEWLSEEGSLQTLSDRLRASDPGRNGPYHFQAVLRTDVRQKVPGAATLVSWILL